MSSQYRLSLAFQGMSEKVDCHNITLSALNKSFVTERDQCPQTRFDIKLKECRVLQSKTNYNMVENSLDKIQVENHQGAITPKVWCLEL